MSKDYFGGLNVIDEQERAHQRCFARRIMAGTLIGAFFAACLLYGVKKANADPLFRAQVDGVSITVYNEPCELDSIKNLPYKVVWIEGGAEVKGCWGAWRDQGFVFAYFEDKTVAVIPFSAFAKVVGA